MSDQDDDDYKAEQAKAEYADECETNRTQITRSIDGSLRDRIAAALYRHVGKDSGISSLQMPWDEAFPIVREHWRGMADAVIAELQVGLFVDQPDWKINDGIDMDKCCISGCHCGRGKADDE